MLLHPSIVRFGDHIFDRVLAVTIDRIAAREVVEFTDFGPHPAWADVPELRTHITVTRRLEAADLAAPVPGEQAELSLAAGGGAHDLGRIRLRAMCVLQAITHDIAAADAARIPARQTLSFIAVSETGETDPLLIEYP